MPDPARCLALPYGRGDIRAALWDPLAAFHLHYRGHDSVRKSAMPWTRAHGPMPFSHADAAKWVRHRCRAAGEAMECKTEWLAAWEDAARAYRRPDGPVAWPYVRVSHDSSAASGLSFEVQIERILDYWRKYIVIFYELDRAARLVSDFAHMMDNVWKPNRIRPHFVNLPGDPDNPGHMLSLNVIAAVAQFFSDQLSRKCRDTAEFLKKVDRPVNQMAPLGYKVVRKGGHAVFEPDQVALTCMARIEHLCDVEGLSWQETDLRLKDEAHRGMGRLPYEPSNPLADCKRVMRMYYAWKKLVKAGVQKRPEDYQRARDRLGFGEDDGFCMVNQCKRTLKKRPGPAPR